jgi:hypothetical protein
MSSKSDEEFQEKLAIGTAGEDLVYPWLKKNNSLVIDFRYQRHEDRKGPRMEGREGSIILPDFAVWNKYPEKGNFAVDVKVKSSPFWLKGKLHFAVDDYKFDDYVRCVQVMNLDFLQLIFVNDGNLYVYRDSDNKGRHYFGNSHGEYGYLFELDESKKRPW